MSRSGYIDACESEQAKYAMWRGQVTSAMRGRRGQRLLRALAASLDAMTDKALVASEEGEIVTEAGDCCTIGSLALAEGWPDAKEVDSTDYQRLASRLDVAECLVREIEHLNDDWSRSETPAERWTRIREWVGRAIGEEVQP